MEMYRNRWPSADIDELNELQNANSKNLCGVQSLTALKKSARAASRTILTIDFDQKILSLRDYVTDFLPVQRLHFILSFANAFASCSLSVVIIENGCADANDWEAFIEVCDRC